jgi:redox-sensitive bicupin YhaK (pirin superfamily)
LKTACALPRIPASAARVDVMFELRPGGERGFADHGWLQSRHSFSFAGYFDPDHVQFGALRVINEDRVAPGQGFATHGHKEMEIISYVLAGTLEHKDSIGTGSLIRPGDVQRMSAGTGVLHSEFNPSSTDAVHFLQIWILPATIGLAPEYEQKHFPEREKYGRLRLIASVDGADGSVTVHQDVRLYAGTFDGEQAATLPLAPQRRGYVHLARGSADIGGRRLEAGDALKITGEEAVRISRARSAEALVFDLA